MFGEFASSLDTSDWIALASSLVAVLSSVFAFFYGVAARRSERRLRILESQASRIDHDMMAWGTRCVDSMSCGHILLATAASGRSPAEICIERDKIQSELSALVDIGRLHVPNRSPDLEGRERPRAYRGFRPAILDAVMLVHEELRHATAFDNENAKQAAHNVFAARRIFISEFQEELEGFRDTRALEKLRTADDDWTEITKLVDDHEARLGVTFWKKRPRPHRQLLAEWRKEQGRSNT